ARALERPPAKATRVAMLRAKLDRTRERSHPPRLPAGMTQRTEAAAIVSQVKDPAQHPFVSHASRNTVSIQPFQQRHHNTSRASQRLAHSVLHRLNVDRQRWTMGSACDNGSVADEIALA